MNSDAYKIMIVEDESPIATQLDERLTSLGYEIIGCPSSGEEAINIARSQKPDIILMDIVMPYGKLDGIDAAKIIKEELESTLSESDYLSNIYKWCPASTKCAPGKQKTKWWKGK